MCEQVDSETHTASAPLIVRDFGRIALFELQQELRVFENDGSCELPGNEDEVSVRIRNVTNCEYSFRYRLSIFEGNEGTSIERTASVRQNAVDDQGVVITDLGILVDRAQFVLTASEVVQGACL